MFQVAEVGVISRSCHSRSHKHRRKSSAVPYTTDTRLTIEEYDLRPKRSIPASIIVQNEDGERLSWFRRGGIQRSAVLSSELVITPNGRATQKLVVIRCGSRLSDTADRLHALCDQLDDTRSVLRLFYWDPGISPAHIPPDRRIFASSTTSIRSSIV